MSRVFVGGEGVMSGGMFDRSRERFDLDDRLDEVFELGSYSLNVPEVGEVGDAGAEVLFAILTVVMLIFFICVQCDVGVAFLFWWW